MTSMYREESERDKKNVFTNLNLKRKGKSNKASLKKGKFILIKFKSHKLKS